MINRWIGCGRITRDIELRKTPNGASTVSFTVACNRRSKQEGQPDADFINCVAWNKVADLTAQYCYKGMLVGVEGRIQTRSYDGKDGKRVYVTEILADSIQFLESRQNNGNSQTSNYSQTSQNNATVGQNAFEDEFVGDTLDIASDDLPF